MAQGSLLGKADPTLAKMSYAEAMADVTPDFKDVYEKEAANQVLFQVGIENYFDTLYADNNALGDELIEATTQAMADLSAGTTPDDSGMEMYNTYLTELKNRMKSLPKGKKGDFERSKIRAELSRLKNSTTDMDQTLTTLGTMIENGDFIANATGNDNLSLLLAISKKEAKREIINGNLFYSIPNPAGGKDIKMNQAELKEALVQTDAEETSGFNAVGTGFNTSGKQKGTNFDLQGAINAYTKAFKTKKGFAANINTNQGSLGYTFLEALQGKDGSNTIYKALTDMGQTTIDKYDVTGDNKITSADFAHPANGVALIKSLTDIHYKNDKGESLFDFQTAKKVAAEFYAEQIGRKEFNDGVAMRVGQGGGGEGGIDGSYFPKGTTWVKLGPVSDSGKQTAISVSQANGIIDDIKSGTTFPFHEHTYDYIDGAWWEDWEKGDTEDSDSYIGDEESLRLNVFRTTSNAFRNLETVKAVDAATGETKEEPKDDGKIYGVDGATELTNSIFDKKEGTAATTLGNILGSKYAVFEGGVGVDYLRIRTAKGEKVEIVKVEQDANGEWVPIIGADGNYVYKDRVDTDFRKRNLDRKEKEKMQFYYTFADPKSKNYDPDIFRTSSGVAQSDLNPGG